jgi:nitroreductase
MDLRTVLRTTPATRAFTDDPLPDDTLYEILDDARFAPNGGNRQGWHVIVIRDPATKGRIAELYELGMREYLAHIQAGLVPFVASEAFGRNPPGSAYRAAVDLEAARQVPLPTGFPQYLADAPVLLVLTLDLSGISAVDSGLDRLSISAGASIYPFAHNVLLAARDRGFGGHFTSVLARQEPALRELLRIPSEQVLGTMLPLGRPVKEITKLRRLAVEEFTRRETADGAPFGAGRPLGAQIPSG